GLDESAQIQPVISKRQQEQILNYFSIAQAEGASILCPDISHLTEGFYVPPAVITNLQVTSRILKEEIFGPVIALVSFYDINEVINYANNTDYGLAASLWTNNLKHTMDLTRKIEAGTVWVNSHVPLDPAMPF